MRKDPLAYTYNEPTVMWRMQHRDGRWAHAVIGLQDHGASVVWFVNGRPLGARDFDDWAAAIQWSDRMRFQNWTLAWRLESERDDAPPTRGDPNSLNRH